MIYNKEYWLLNHNFLAYSSKSVQSNKALCYYFVVVTSLDKFHFGFSKFLSYKSAFWCKELLKSNMESESPGY